MYFEGSLYFPPIPTASTFGLHFPVMGGVAMQCSEAQKTYYVDLRRTARVSPWDHTQVSYCTN